MNKIKLTSPGIFLGLLILSTLFPITASLLDVKSLPVWMGITDVTLAFILVMVMIFTVKQANGKISPQVKERSSTVYQSLGTLPLVLLVIFFVFGEAVKWEILLPGLAWRAWVFIYSLPSVLALLQDSNHPQGGYRN